MVLGLWRRSFYHVLVLMKAFWYYLRLFVFSKWFSLTSNISSFSFKQWEYIFDWGLCALNWFFNTHVTFGLEFPAFKFQYWTDSFVSFLYLLMLNDLLWFAYRFLSMFTNFFVVSGYVILFVTRYCRYVQDVF